MKGNFSKIRWRELIICLLLFSAALGAYWQIKNHDFINYDDEMYVTENLQVKKGLTFEGVAWAFSAGYATNWHPITWLSHMLDCELYGLNPMGHHWTNVQIHIASTILLFLVFNWMTGALWQSSVVAALFALHPLHVESVAWVAERKDVLCAFFWILSIWAYARYIRLPVARRYLLLTFFFTLGLMAKPMMVTLPFVLLLLDFWPLYRFNSKYFQFHPPGRHSLIALVLEKVPLFGLSAVSSTITYYVQQGGGAVASLDVLPFKARFVNALISYLRYLGKMIWPRNLSVFYPYPQWPVEYAVISGVLIICVSVAIVRAARKYPYLLTGWFWYLGTLFPVIGLIHAGSQSMADRYTYIPLMGMFILIAWGLADVSKPLRSRNVVLALAAGVALCAMMVCTWFQVCHWQNTLTLFTHVLKVTRNNSVAYFSLGYGLDKQGKLDEALSYYMKSLEINPGYKNAHNNIGFILARRGKTEAAIDHYQAELRLFPENADTHNNLANALSDQARLAKAAIHYRLALSINPEHANAHYNFGNLLLRQARFKDALAHSAEAIRINPNFAEAYNQIGVILFRQKKIEKALDFFSMAIQINTGYSQARKNLETVKQAR